MHTSTIRKILALLLALCLLTVCLTACGDSKKSEEKETTTQSKKDKTDKDKNDKNDKEEGKEDDKDTSSDQTDDEDPYVTDTGFLFYHDDHVELGTPDKTLDPQEVYDNLTYIPEMFYGDYMILGGDEAQEEFGKNSEFTDWTLEGKTQTFSVLPFGFLAGKHSPAHSVTFIEGYHWMYTYFMHKYDDESIYLDVVLCAYTVEGNTVTLRPLDKFHVDQETGKITYAFSEMVLDYEFSFCGRQLTLTKGDASVTMWAGLDPYHEENYIYTDAYLVQGTQPLGNMDTINFRYHPANEDPASAYLFVDNLEGDTVYHTIAHLEENGLFTITIPWDEDTVTTYQMVYFLCGKDGIIFTDGTNNYLYTHNYSDRNKTDLRDFVTEDQTGQMDKLSDSQLEQIVQTKAELLADLEKAFKDEGIKVTVNAETGEMTMDASVLFGGDSSVLTDAGKEVVRRFVEVYTTVAFADEYKGFISHTMVEGHTAPTGSTYEQSLPLSYDRANVVRDYCLSLNSGLSADDLEAIGYSNSRPVKDKDGKVDMAASRRVSFRFIIDLEQFLN